MAASRSVVVDRRGALGAALADDVADDTPPPRQFRMSPYDQLRLRRIAAEELAACDAGNLREALRLSELYELEERKALGLSS